MGCPVTVYLDFWGGEAHAGLGFSHWQAGWTHSEMPPTTCVPEPRTALPMSPRASGAERAPLRPPPGAIGVPVACRRPLGGHRHKSPSYHPLASPLPTIPCRYKSPEGIYRGVVYEKAFDAGTIPLYGNDGKGFGSYFVFVRPRDSHTSVGTGATRARTTVPHRSRCPRLRRTVHR